MKQLGVEVRMHMPRGSDGRRTTARSKGKVERLFPTTKCSLETLYHLQQPESLDEANVWLHKYLQEYNAMDHRHEDHSRLDDWLLNLPAARFPGKRCMSAYRNAVKPRYPRLALPCVNWYIFAFGMLKTRKPYQVNYAI